MKACLVGRVVGDYPSTFALREWGKRAWRIGGELQVRRLPKGLFLSHFPSVSKAERVLKAGKKDWQGGYILMDVWHPTAGCRWNEREEGKIWFCGLPLHLWGRNTFEKIGEVCGSLIDYENYELESAKWVVLRACKPKIASEHVWVSDEMLVYQNHIWK